ncbi:hypothetical protein [Streptomyces nigrescens]|uniref:Uncharacterized protein n=1 Tax=Streptomyces nigrescens TaxID=1920 RepID=A0ABY7IYU5_STRNI|nr:hypothetical protein [Streptomyces nigrescens]WAU04184.1 hypothetical protein STRNI_002430 [Streptomyces nigrescens]
MWTTGGWAATGVWLCGPVLRIGLMGIAAAMGIHRGSAATMLSVAAMLLICAGATTWRARAVQHTYGVLPPAWGRERAAKGPRTCR